MALGLIVVLLGVLLLGAVIAAIVAFARDRD